MTRSWSERVVIRDGVRLSCRDWGGGDGADDDGSAPAVVLLHGLAGHAGEWDATAVRLRAEGHRVVAVDQRGHGLSERLPQDTSRAAYVADAVAVIDQLALTRTVLIGQSLGGHAAMLTAAAHPGLLSGVVLVEAGAAQADPGVADDIGAWLKSWPVPFPTREAAAGFLGGGPVGEGWAAGLEERDGGGLWPRFDAGVMVRSLAENATRAWWEEWAAIDCPKLMVIAQNGIITADEFDGMAGRRPDTWAASVPATGHDVHLERPDALHQLLAAFLRDVDVTHAPDHRRASFGTRAPGHTPVLDRMRAPRHTRAPFGTRAPDGLG
ncbi:alpha/beta fold hydrolase [Streptomyces sp. NPDC056543]|uniref:alpha/beta fold hydrolase n=1 Tax=unclassified Streptomyces TaxID=2593676 RepID=UPI003680F7AE